MSSPSDVKVLGVADNFFVLSDDRYIRTFDAQCKPIARSRDIDFDSALVAGHTFTLDFGKYIVTYDERCKVISKRRP